jgi:hypothetical protein
VEITGDGSDFKIEPYTDRGEGFPDAVKVLAENGPDTLIAATYLQKRGATSTARYLR